MSLREEEEKKKDPSTGPQAVPTARILYVQPSTKKGDRIAIEIVPINQCVRLLKAFVKTLPNSIEDSQVVFLPTGILLSCNVYAEQQSRRAHTLWLRSTFFHTYRVDQKGILTCLNILNLAEKLEEMEKTHHCGGATLLDTPENTFVLVAKTVPGGIKNGATAKQTATVNGVLSKTEVDVSSSTNTSHFLATTTRLVETPIMTKPVTVEALQRSAMQTTAPLWLQPNTFLSYPCMFLMETSLLHDVLRTKDKQGVITLEFDGSTNAFRFKTTDLHGQEMMESCVLPQSAVVENPFLARDASKIVLFESQNNAFIGATSTLPSAAVESTQTAQMDLTRIQDRFLRQTLPISGLWLAVEQQRIGSTVQLFMGKDQPSCLRFLLESERSDERKLDSVFPQPGSSSAGASPQFFYDQPSQFCTLLKPVVLGMTPEFATAVAVPTGTTSQGPSEQLLKTRAEERQLIQMAKAIQAKNLENVKSQADIQNVVKQGLKEMGISPPTTKKARGRPKKERAA